MDAQTVQRPGAVAALIRKPWIFIAVVGIVIFFLWARGTRTQDHHVRVGFPTAVNLVPGLDVQIDGIDAGKVSKVDYLDGKAVVELGINDDRWPLRRGATATIRFGTTVGNGTRRVDVDPGPADAPALPEGGVIQGADAIPPVEFDQVFNTLNRDSRARMRSMLGNTAASFDGHEEELNRGLKDSARGMAALEALVGDVGADTGALRNLVVNGHRTTRALASRKEQITSLVTVAGATFDEFARRSTSMKQSLDELPSTLQSVQSTLKRVDTSVDGLEPLVADLKPGAAALRRLAPTAASAVHRIREQAPVGVAALRSLRKAAPDARRLLQEATPVTSILDDVFEKTAPIAGCLRPYAPELVSALSNWASWGKNYDGISHFARIKVTASPYSLNATPDLTTEQYLKAFPMLNYALPRPPGLNAGKPWFLPECGVGPDSLDPSKDPEDTARPGNPTTGPVAENDREARGGGASQTPQPTGLDLGLGRLVAPLLEEIRKGATTR